MQPLSLLHNTERKLGDGQSIKAEDMHKIKKEGNKSNCEYKQVKFSSFVMCFCFTFHEFLVAGNSSIIEMFVN